jgi:integrase
MSVREQTRHEGGQVTKFWIVDVKFRHPDGRVERFRRVPRVQTRRAAEQLERELLATLAGGGMRKEEEAPPLFADFAREFEDTYAMTNNKPSERASKEMILRVHLVPAFGTKRLDAITPLDIERYKAGKIKAGRSAKSVNNHLTVLHKLLAVAVEWGKLRTVPTIKWLKVPRPEITWLSHEETARLVAAAEGTWRTMIFVGLHTGLRQGELLALEWQDVDLVAGKLTVRRNIVRGIVGTPKSGKPREVPLNATALAALKAHRSLRRLVFTPAEGDRHLRKNECRRPLYGACRKAGLRQLGWHVLRHTFASHLVMAGAPLKSVQELLGHATIEMTMRYAHLSPEARQEAVRLLDTPRGHRGATEKAE